MFKDGSEIRAALAALPPAQREMVNELWKRGHWVEAIRCVEMLHRLKAPGPRRVAHQDAAELIRGIQAIAERVVPKP
jgi:hypothetical protein